ncbi:BACON domain-containing protein [Prevotella copri]|uniref:BACON domain-containing protein n=1 Tax=Segatella copri TaxID=165179 RepID=A0AAP2TW96_9BACT|nr:BACON domain-containing protein [Segatella copri]MBM0264095.1 BACON domain-containing protein [Segatella copri]MCE4123331.1 BACON domain-containing protein [Segatella copri]MCF0068550.1 BACON domain-containing protein [Segatella copri]MCP9459507.1 BACON domain-containing protein [Segatella copri]MCP9499657.1 BACON domain-containing protein [Segatella copri]
MKYINKLTWLLVLGAGLMTASCSDSDDVDIPGGLAIDKEQIEIAAEGGSEQLAIAASQNWVANVDEPWLMLTPANGVGSTTATVVVDSTLMNGRRTTDIVFIGDNGQRRTVSVKQFGYGKQIDIKEPTVEIENSESYDKRAFESLISANVECKIGKIEYSFEGDMTDAEKAENESEREGWLLNSKDEDKLTGTNLGIVLDRKARPRSVKFKFRWAMNVVPAVRVAKVHLVPVKAEDQLVDADGKPTDDVILTVRQKAAPKIEDNRAGDSLSVIMINQKLGSIATFDSSDNMRNWSGVTLWEATDAFVKDHPEALGRVRSVKFSMFNLKSGETLPKEVGNLKFLESFSVAANENNQIREVKLGEEICSLKYLKNLTVQAYGLIQLPTNFVNLGKSLETLNLVSNNFNKLSDITNIVNEKNFPKLRNLILYAQRRTDVVTNIASLGEMNASGVYVYNNYPIGLYGKVNAGTADRQALLKLLTWDKLNTLELSYCFLEGELPTDEEMTEALEAAGKATRYSRSDFSTNKADYLDKLVGDTCKWLLSGWDNPVTCKHKDGSVVYEDVYPLQVPRVLPNCRQLSLNLNFLTGAVPKWILYHPHLVEWTPSIMIFNQQPKGKNSDGAAVGFSNMTEDSYSYDYYYGTSDPGSKWEVPGVAYPLYYRKYVAAGDINEAALMAKYRRTKKK